MNDHPSLLVSWSGVSFLDFQAFNAKEMMIHENSPTDSPHVCRNGCLKRWTSPFFPSDDNKLEYLELGHNGPIMDDNRINIFTYFVRIVVMLPETKSTITHGINFFSILDYSNYDCFYCIMTKLTSPGSYIKFPAKIRASVIM